LPRGTPFISEKSNSTWADMGSGSADIQKFPH
jgi:hypothetical protein